MCYEICGVGYGIHVGEAAFFPLSQGCEEAWGDRIVYMTIPL